MSDFVTDETPKIYYLAIYYYYYRMVVATMLLVMLPDRGQLVIEIMFG